MCGAGPPTQASRSGAGLRKRPGYMACTGRARAAAWPTMGTHRMGTGRNEEDRDGEREGGRKRGKVRADGGTERVVSLRRELRASRTARPTLWQRHPSCRWNSCIGGAASGPSTSRSLLLIHTEDAELQEPWKFVPSLRKSAAENYEARCADCQASITKS